MLRNEEKLKQRMMTKFPGLFSSYKLRVWEVDTKDRALICHEDENNKKRNYSIKHLEVLEGDRENRFIINVEPNQMIYIEADSEEIKDRWIKAITKIIKEIKIETKKRINSNFQINSEAKMKNELNQSKGFNISKKIEKELLPVPWEHLKQLGLNQFLKYLDRSYVQYNILAGQHRVKSRDFIPRYKQRFLILMSSKSLYPEKHVTDVILMQSQLPPQFNLNTLYEYNLKGKQKGKSLLEVKQIIEISGVTYESSYHIIKINTGKIIHSLSFDSYAMANKWRKLLLIAKRNSEEVVNNGTKIKKNIDPILVQLKQKKLHQRLIAFYDSHKPVNHLVSQLLQFLNKTKFQLQSICEASLAKQPPKPQLITFYFDYFHQKIFTEIKLAWDKRYQLITPMQMVQLIVWLEDYSLVFIDYVNDTRFQQGITTLCRIAGRKVSKQLRPLILSISQSDKQDNFFDQDGILFTNSIIDVFKFVNDSINIYYDSKCSKQLMWMFCVLSNTSFKTYITALKQIVDDHKLSSNQLIAITNDSGWFVGLIAEFIQQRASSTGYDQDALKVYIQSQQLCRTFIELGTVTRDKLCAPALDKINKYYRGRKYLTVKVQNIISMIFEPQFDIQSLNSLNKKNYWKVILQNITNQLIRCIACSFEKNNKQILRKTVDKIHLQLDVLTNEFEQLVGSMTLTAMKQKFTKVLIILGTQDAKVIVSIFKSTQFKDNVYIVKLTEYRIDNIVLQKAVAKQLQDDEDIRDRSRKSTFKSMKLRKSTIFQNFDGDERLSITEQEEEDDVQYSDEVASTVDNPATISQGYMQKKKDNHKFFQTRYFRLKKGNLYWFADEDSQISQNQINLKQVQQIAIKTPQKPTFVVIIKNHGKVSQYKLKCKSIEQRDLWVKSIHLQIKSLTNKQKTYKPMKVQQKSTLIIDYDQMQNPQLMDDEFSSQRRKLHDQTIALRKPKGQSAKNSRKVSRNNLSTRQIQSNEPVSGIKAFFYGLFP